jgi:hypothetical protein
MADRARCTCGGAQRFVCKKEGPNKGRPFWTCRPCGFFESDDGRPWIRGRTVGAKFRPFKAHLRADPSLRAEYETETTIELNQDGVGKLAVLLKPRALFGRRSDGPDAVRVDDYIKIARGKDGEFTVKRRPQRKRRRDEDGADPAEGPPPGGTRGYCNLVGEVRLRGSWAMTCCKGEANAEAAERVRAFVEQLAEDAERTIADMGKATGSCCMCGLPLSDPDSLVRGYGPVCAKYVVSTSAPPK